MKTNTELSVSAVRETGATVASFSYFCFYLSFYSA